MAQKASRLRDSYDFGLARMGVRLASCGVMSMLELFATFPIEGSTGLETGD